MEDSTKATKRFPSTQVKFKPPPIFRLRRSISSQQPLSQYCTAELYSKGGFALFVLPELTTTTAVWCLGADTDSITPPLTPNTLSHTRLLTYHATLRRKSRPIWAQD